LARSARKVANRVIFMDEGKIIEDTNKDDFFNNPQSDRARHHHHRHPFMRQFNHHIQHFVNHLGIKRGGRFINKVANRVIFMDEGKIIEDTNKDDFFNNPQSDRAKDLIYP
jgi:ABC-type polar amino acid transport system ATPase subunit